MTRLYRVLTGPTAAGKTAWLLARAAHQPLLIVSADSRQVYLHMNIGTGKPTLTDRKILPHYVVDCATPAAVYSVHQFLIDAADGFAAARRQRRELWVSGGTGLYIRSLVESLELGTPPHPALRRALAARLSEVKPRQAAQALELELRDPDNPVRVIRAAELACRDAGRARRIYQWAGLEFDAAAPQLDGGEELAAARAEFDRWRCDGIVVLDPGRAALERAIVRRTSAMFSEGLVEEVANLRELGYGEAPVVSTAIGYREAGLLLDGGLTAEEALKRTIIRTRQYAKRQRTYFRGRGWPVVTRDGLDRRFAAAAE